jgi:polyhydroxybutyrate depolymerase
MSKFTASSAVFATLLTVSITAFPAIAGRRPMAGERCVPIGATRPGRDGAVLTCSPARRWVTATPLPTTQPPTTQPPTTVPPTSGASGPQNPGLGSMDQITLNVGGRTRTALLTIAQRTGPTPRPLVVVLHGGGGTGSQIAANTGFAAMGELQHFDVVFPDGIDKNWNDGRNDAVSTAAREHVDDVAFIRALIEEVTRRTPTDRAKVFVTGMSNGAMMTMRLACEASDVFAGFAAVSGTGSIDLAQTCKPVKAISLLQIHGDADPIVAYGGGSVHSPIGAQDRGSVIGVDDLATFITALDRCGNQPVVSSQPNRDAADGSTITTRTWTGCANAMTVTFWKVVGGGHVWPGERTHLPERLVGRGNRDIDATAEVWSFFAAL